MSVISLGQHRLPEVYVPNRTRQATAAWLLQFTSTHTRDAYARDLNLWTQFCADHDTDPLTAIRGHLSAWARTMEAEGRAPRTVARRIAAMASWYGYLVEEDVIDHSPCDALRRPQISDEGETVGLTQAETRQLLAAADSPRSSALLTLLAFTGLRINEALARDVEDLGYDRGHRILRIVRKGGKSGRTVLSAHVAGIVDAYLDGRATGPIFITSTGQRMRQPEAYRCVRRTAIRAGLDSARQLSPHSLRVAFITTALEENVQLVDVQDAAGHKDPRTTRRYDRGRHSLNRHATYAVTAALAPDDGPA